MTASRFSKTSWRRWRLLARAAVFIPISAKDGDNMVNKSDKTPWYEGPTLLNYLETVPVVHKTVSDFFRFPVQYVIRPISSQFPDYRGYAGRVSGGIIRPAIR